MYESQKQQNSITNLTRNLFVKGLPDGCTDQQLRTAFETYGPVTSARVKQGRNHGYVCFANDESASKAVYEATLMSPFPGAPVIDVEYFKPKQMRDQATKEVYETSV